MHDTELCAWWEPPYCNRLAQSQDLCSTHHRLAVDAGRTRAPKFRRTRSITSHVLFEIDEERGTAVCSICGPTVSMKRTRGGEKTCQGYSYANVRKWNTGWSEIDFDNALIAQGNRCWLCSSPPTPLGLVGDHCHAKNKPRRLLCSWCNNGLGMFKDDPTTLRRAADYVEEVW